MSQREHLNFRRDSHLEECVDFAVPHKAKQFSRRAESAVEVVCSFVRVDVFPVSA